MSKIPQGEWNAIAARYAQGESISRIAQTYGCTPPAIHYILKRNTERTALNRDQPQNGQSRVPLIAAPEAAQALGETRTSPLLLAELDTARDRHPPPARAAQIVANPLPILPQRLEPVRDAVRANRFAAGLDRELHGRAEAAIEAFRSSFDAALSEESAVVRQRLRQAAADLMRVAARTTIVLDQLNARAER